MSGTKQDLVNYRLFRAKDTFDDALILIEKQKWNSAINRLYYASYYAVIALLVNKGINTSTHNGTKAKFSEEYVKTGKIDLEFGKIYSQLFTWRQKGDYDDLFDFTEEKVKPYILPVKNLIDSIEQLIGNEI